MTTSLRLALLALALAVPACVDNFDPALHMGGRDAPDAFDAGAADGGFVINYADQCTGLAPSIIPTGLNIFPVDTTGSIDDMHDLAECVGVVTPGNDTFLTIDAAPNERWHFHVRQSSGSTVDPVLYLLDGCNELNCNENRAINACGNGSNEHLSVVAPASGGTFFLGVDSTEAGGFTGMLEIYRPICGSNGAEHSENCDDGNLENGDGCDSQCRTELAADPRQELGANDDYFGANHVLNLGSSATVLGSIGTGCDVDVYALDLTAGDMLTSTLEGRGGGCPGLSPEVRMSILAPTGTVELRVAGPTQCPTIAYTVPSTGTYYVRVTVPDGGGAFDYDLTFAVTTP